MKNSVFDAVLMLSKIMEEKGLLDSVEKSLKEYKVAVECEVTGEDLKKLRSTLQFDLMMVSMSLATEGMDTSKILGIIGNSSE